ncbi:MAG: prohead protease/major capsid protein fusion protein [Alphaproteobacteria bacterium]
MPDAITRDLPMQVRAGTFTPASIDEEKRTIDLVWTTGARVRRFDWWNGRVYDEELAVDEKSIDLSRLNGGAPLLDTHGTWRLGSILGVVERAWIEKGEGHATVRFSERADLAPVWQDVRGGIIRNVSVGYQVRKYKVTEEEGKPPVYRAVDWQPHELSLVPVGADAGAGTRAEGGDRRHPCEFVHDRAPAHTKETDMTEKTPAGGGSPADDSVTGGDAARNTPATPPAGQPAAGQSAADAAAAAVAAERTRAAEVRKLGTKAGMDAGEIDAMVNDGLTVEQARIRAFDAMAARAEAAPTRSGVIVTADEGEKLRALAENALMHRHDPGMKLEDGARQFRGLTLMEMGADILGRRGISLKGKGRMERATAVLGLERNAGGMHGTGDFPYILANVATKTLRRAYEATPQTFKPFTRRANLPDFKEVQRTQFGDAPQLLKVTESGEFTRGTAGEAREVWSLSTYGRIFAITRQAIINDDLDAFTRIPAGFGRRAADLESDVVWSIVTTNAAMADGNALFHSSHGNLASPTSAPAVSSLSVARTAMRKQTSIDGNLINVMPKFIMVPAELETVVQQLLAAITANTSSAVNPFAGSLTQIVEPRLSAASTAAWYLSADPAQIDTIEYGSLDGSEGVFVDTRVGFDVDGVEIKARHDFGAKAIDWRGLYRNGA